jgi:hypothetical protein
MSVSVLFMHSIEVPEEIFAPKAAKQTFSINKITSFVNNILQYKRLRYIRRNLRLYPNFSAKEYPLPSQSCKYRLFCTTQIIFDRKEALP